MKRDTQLMLDILLCAESDEGIQAKEGSFIVSGNSYGEQEYYHHLKLLHEGGYISAPSVSRNLSGGYVFMGTSHVPVITNQGYNKISQWRITKSQNPNNSRSSLPPSDW